MKVIKCIYHNIDNFYNELHNKKLLEDKEYYTKKSQFYFIFRETSPNFYNLIVQHKLDKTEFIKKIIDMNKNLFIIALPINILIFNIDKKIVFDHQNLLIYDSHNDMLEYFEPFGKLKFTQYVWENLQKFFDGIPKDRLMYNDKWIQQNNNDFNLECTNINIIYAKRRNKIVKSYANDLDLTDPINYNLMITNIKNSLANILYSPYSGILSGGNNINYKQKYAKYKQKYLRMKNRIE